MVGIKKRKKEIMGNWKNNFIAKNPSPFKRAEGGACCSYGSRVDGIPGKVAVEKKKKIKNK